MRFFILVGRALRLRCPLCGEGRLFRGWFAMHKQCPHCAATFEREPGFYLGSIYINYGITVLIVTIVYPTLLFNGILDKNTLLVGSLAFTLVFPVLVFPWRAAYGWDSINGAIHNRASRGRESQVEA